jgi:Copper transport outer membrane protein, MctB
VIDFRYHLVSLVAVFLALAVGIVLGAGPLNDTLGHALEKQTQALTAQKRDLQGQVTALQSRVSYGEDVAADLVAPTVFGRLTGTRVVVVAAPGADGKLVESLTKVLGQSGAVVTGHVKLDAAYVDPAKASLLGDLTSHLAPTGVDLPSTGPYDAAGFVLADALVTSEPLLRGKPDANSQALFAGFTQAGLLTVTGDVDERADIALVVAPTAPDNPTDATTAENAALMPLIVSIDDSGRGELVAGPEGSAATGGLVRAVRDDHDVRREVSTEDVANLSSGQIGTILALLEQFQGGVGHYGDGPGATEALPRLTPDGVPSPSPSKTPAKSPSKSATPSTSP